MTTDTRQRFGVHISTVGCRANQADSDELAALLDADVAILVDDPAVAALVIVNTCCVTAEAERDCRRLAHRALAASPSAQVALVGCAANAVPEFGVDIDARIIVKRRAEAEPAALAVWINGLAGSAAPSAPTHRPTRAELGRSRPQLKVQTGCSHGCSYCIVPRARGPERSVPLAEVVGRAAALAAEGFGEIVLAGVQLGAYGVDQPERPTLAALVTAVARAVAPGRVRLGSVEPWSIDEALAAALALPNVCPHLHLPLQSGDDPVLERMGRGYTAAEYLARVQLLRSSVPGIAIGTDVLLGFPGEDESSFQRTLAVLEQLAPAYLHAFPYSPRSHTRASFMSDWPSRELAKARVRVVRELGDRSRNRFRALSLGTVHEVVVEEPRRGEWHGLTGHFIPVRLLGLGASPPGRLVQASLSGDPAAVRLDAQLLG